MEDALIILRQEVQVAMRCLLEINGVSLSLHKEMITLREKAELADQLAAKVVQLEGVISELKSGNDNLAFNSDTQTSSEQETHASVPGDVCAASPHLTVLVKTEQMDDSLNEGIGESMPGHASGQHEPDSGSLCCSYGNNAKNGLIPDRIPNQATEEMLDNIMHGAGILQSALSVVDSFGEQSVSGEIAASSLRRTEEQQRQFSIRQPQRNMPEMLAARQKSLKLKRRRLTLEKKHNAAKDSHTTYSCTYCSFSSCYASSVSTHMKAQHQTKPQQMNRCACGYETPYKHALLRHLRGKRGIGNESGEITCWEVGACIS